MRRRLRGQNVQVGLKTGIGNEEMEIGNEKLHFHWQGLACVVGTKAHPSLPARLPEISPRDGWTISSDVEDEVA